MLFERAVELGRDGDLVASLTLLGEAAGRAREQGQTNLLAEILGETGWILRRTGDHDAAIDAYTRAVEAARAAGDGVQLAMWLASLVGVLGRAERPADARRWLGPMRDAAAATGHPKLMADAVQQHAAILAVEHRYAEAVQLLEEAERDGSLDAERQPDWCFNKALTLAKWGLALRDEGQLAEARETLDAAVSLFDTAEPKEARFALSAYMQLIEIADLRNDQAGLRRASQASEELARQLGYEFAAPEAAADAVGGHGVDMDDRDIATRIAEYEKQLEAALPVGDTRAEVLARTNLAIARLAAGEDTAWDDFELALTAASRSGDRRSELLLTMYFAHPAIARGERQRAIQLAERAVRLATDGTPLQRGLAAMVRGSVRLDATDDMAGAHADYREAVAELEAVDALRDVLPSLGYEHLPRVASAARRLGDGALLRAAARLLGVTSPEPTEPAHMPTAEELSAQHDEGLDIALTAWAASGGPRRSAKDDRIAAMIQMAEASRWPAAAARLGGARTVTPTGHPSAGGPAGLLRLSELVVDGTVDQDTAIAVAGALAVPSDALACTCLFAVSCRQVAEPNVVLLQLGLSTTHDDGLAGRLCWLLQIYASVFGDQEQRLAFIDAGIERLGGGADEPLLGFLVNEAAVVLIHLGRPQAALERAEDAVVRADQLGDHELGDLARRNRVSALTALGRAEDAEARLVELEAAQVARGDADALRVTRIDLAKLRARRGTADDQPLDADETDPDSVFASAMALAYRGDHGAALERFRQGFALVAQKGTESERQGDQLRDYAHVLWEAGHPEEAVEQMDRAVSSFERAGRLRDACEAHTRLAASLLTEPDRARAYGERAVAAAERIGADEPLAEALAALASAEMAARRPEAALEHLSRAVELDPSPEILLLHVQALTACDRAAEAVKILEDLPAQPDWNEPRLRAGWLAALSQAVTELGEREYALSALAAAYDVARHLPADALSASIAESYAVALNAAGYHARAATVLEEACSAVRDAGFLDLEEGLMASLGSTLRHLGDLASAERVLTEVCARRRRRGRDHVLAQSIYALGAVSLARGRHREALDWLREANAVAEGAGDVQTQASALDTMGLAHAELGRPERAVEYHRRAATLHGAIGRHDHEVQDRCGLVHALVLLGDAAAARSELEVALALHERVPTGLAVDHVAAQVHALDGDWQAANGLFRSSLEGVSRAHPTETPADVLTRANLLDRVFREAARAAIEADDAASAFVYTEARRARYQRAVIERRVRRPPAVGVDAWREYEDAADEVADVRTHRRSAAFASRAFDARYHQALERLEAASAAVFESGEPATASPPEQLPQFDDLIAAVSPGSAVVCAAAGPDGLEVVRAGRSSRGVPWADCSTHPGFTSAELEDLLFGAGGWVESWSESTDEPEYEELDATVTQVCATLAADVWPALVDGLPDDCRELFLMPSGGLATLPLHSGAVLSGAAAPLSVQYAPSLSVPRPERPEPGLPQEVLGQVVDPLGDLPFTRCEAEAVAGRHDGPVRGLRGPDATADGVLELLRTADIVQFAGHAEFDAQDPVRSALVCAAGHGSTERLNVAALLRETEGMRSRMILLSACESGRVDAHDPLDEHLGLAGVLVAVGACSVLASQWPVDDLVAALVISEFFARWEHGRVAAPVALAQAQTWLRDQVTVEHVRSRLNAWARVAQGDEEFEQRRLEWAEPADPQLRPFRTPLEWAPFHLVATPLSKRSSPAGRRTR
jgi:tetratricopeptide (TPR) repeat protein